MLYFVQTVMWGVAEKPVLFFDEEKAGVAYVEGVRRNWTQRYAAYCEHHSLPGDSFASAQAFVKTLDLSEKSTVNFWSFDREEAALAEPEHAGAEEFRQLSEGIGAVKDGLARLLEDVAGLAERFHRPAKPQVEPAVVETEKPAVAYLGNSLKEERQETTPEACAGPEWQTFVGTVKRLATGPRNDFALLTRDDWRQDVYSSRTSLEYWDWVADRIMMYKETAIAADYSITQLPDSAGCWTFGNMEGVTAEETLGSEWEAWCAAGLHAEAGCRSAAV
jgi:hypothetical protein